MNELTRIINLQITIIKEKGKRKFITKEKMAERIARIVKDGIGADDVTVISAQEFLWEGQKSQMAAAFTNADRIRNMSLDEMAAVIMCPYTGEGVHKEALCEKMQLLSAPDDKICIECCKAWLQKEVSNGKSNQ